MLFCFRRSRLDLPAGFGHSDAGTRRKTQQQNRHPTFPSPENQFAIGHQIKNLGFAGKLDHHHAKGCAGEAVHGRPQSTGHIWNPQQNEPRRIKPQLQQACGRLRPVLKEAVILGNPQNWATKPGGKPHHKARRRHFMRGGRKNLMQSPAPQPARQNAIHPGRPQRNSPLRTPCRGENSPQRG